MPHDTFVANYSQDLNVRIRQIESFLSQLPPLPSSISGAIATGDFSEVVVASSPAPVGGNLIGDVMGPLGANSIDALQGTTLDLSLRVDGDLIVYSTGPEQWTASNWTPRDIGIGAAPTHGKLEVTADSDVILWFTDSNTANSGLQGLNLNKDSSSGFPLGVTLRQDLTPLWDTVAIDYTTTDLILAYSHTLKADNFRFRQDSAQLAFGRVVGQPAAAGAQFQLESGNGENVTGISNAANAVFTMASTLGFVVGDTVLVKGITAPAGMAAGINGTSATITAVTSTTVTTTHDTSPYAAWVSGGTLYVSTTGESITGWDNATSLLLLQGLSNTITRRTKIQFGLSGLQLGSDASQDGTNDFWMSLASIFPFYIDANGRVFIGGSGSRPSPTAKLHLGAGTATANTAPLKFTSGTNLTTAEAGSFEYDGSLLYFTPTGTTRRTVAYLPVTPPDYTVSNHTDDRSLDETGDTLQQVANVLGTLINDLIAQGVLQ